MSQTRCDLLRELEPSAQEKKQFADPLYYEPSKNPELAFFFANHPGANRKTGLTGVADPLLRDNLENPFKTPAKLK